MEHLQAPEEVIGKSSNVNSAVRKVYFDLIERQGLDPFRVMLTVADADSILSPLYLAWVEAMFWEQRDGRRLIYAGPLNTYRNFRDGPLVTQSYEVLRSHGATFRK